MRSRFSVSVARRLPAFSRMDRTADAAKFTGETLAWFEQGEVLAANEISTAAALNARRRRTRLAFGFIVACTLLGAAGALGASYLGLLSLELPWGLSLPWQ